VHLLEAGAMERGSYSEVGRKSAEGHLFRQDGCLEIENRKVAQTT